MSRRYVPDSLGSGNCCPVPLPSTLQAILGTNHHWLLRGYCSLHLVAAFATYVGGLPGTGGALQPPDLQQPLTIIGLWRPSVALGMLPVLGLLLLATLHGAVGGAVRRTGRERYIRCAGLCWCAMRLWCLCLLWCQPGGSTRHRLCCHRLQLRRQRAHLAPARADPRQPAGCGVRSRRHRRPGALCLRASILPLPPAHVC